MELFRLFGSVLIDSDEANQSIAETSENAEGLGGKLSDGIKTAAKWGAGLAAGAGVAVGGMVSLIGKTLETTSQISKFAQVTGMSTKGFQEWDSVAKTFGFSMEAAAGDMAALAEKAMDAQSGVGENADIFKELGVSVEDASGKLKTQEQLFNETIAGLQGMEDVTRRNAIATAFLSTTGEELAPVLNMTNEELAAMKANAGVISEEDLAKAEEFRIGWENVKSTFGGLLTEIGISLMPMFKILIDWVTVNMPAIKQGFETAFNGAKDAITTAIEAVKEISIWIKDHWAILEPILAGIAAGALAYGIITGAIAAYGAITKGITAIQLLFNGAMTANPIGIVVVAIGLLVAAGVLLYKNWDTVKEKLGATWEWIKKTSSTVFNGLVDFFKKWGATILVVIGGPIAWIAALIYKNWDEIKTKTSSIWNGIKSFISGLWNGIKSTATDVFNGIKTAISSVWDGIKSKTTSVWDSLKSATTTAFNGIKSAIMTPINAAKDGVKIAIDKIKGFFTGMSLKLPKIKMPSFSIKNWSSNPLDWLKAMPRLDIKWNAKGGIFDKPTIFNTSAGLQGVGEAGSEAILPLNTKTLSGIGKGIAATMGTTQSNPIYITIVSELDGQEVARNQIKYIDGMQYNNSSMKALVSGVNLG